MTNDEIYALPSETLILCADGSMAMLIQLPSDDGRTGVQVPGEPDIRWIDAARLERRGKGAVAETGAPAEPSARKFVGTDQTSGLARMMYSDLWRLSL